MIVTRSPEDIRFINTKERKRAAHEAALRKAARLRRHELEQGNMQAMRAKNLGGSSVAGLLVAEDEVERMLSEQARQSTTHTAAFHGAGALNLSLIHI